MYSLAHRGSFVEVVDGRYAGRRGVVIRIDLVQSGQLHRYPVVLLHARGRARARQHRFVDGTLRVIERDEPEPAVRDTGTEPPVGCST